MSDIKTENCPACGTECYVIQTELEGTAYLDPVEDKRIQELRTALLEAADHIWEHSTGEPPEYNVTDIYKKYRAIAKGENNE